LDQLRVNLGLLGLRETESEGLLSIEPPEALASPDRPLDCGASEEELLLLAALCAGQAARVRLRLQLEQPSSGCLQGIDCLRQLGLEISFTQEADGWELSAGPGEPRPASLELPSQPPWLNSALLIAALGSRQELILREPRSVHDHIYRLLRSLGVELYNSSDGTTLPPDQTCHGLELKLPGCPERAAARLVAALLLPGSDLSLTQVSMNPRRSGLLKLLQECAPAAREGQPGLARTRSWQFGHEPVAALRAVHTNRLRACIILPNRAALLGSELPWLLLLASQGRGTSVLRGFERGLTGSAMRSAYLAELLRSFGIDAEHDHEGWRINGPAPLLAAEVQCAGDPLLSRIALLLARFADGPSLLHGARPGTDPLAWAEAGASEA
jgi:3-phosphoshikimate 1-carboxyvinyltransferase